jgi:hypothetical protein
MCHPVDAEVTAAVRIPSTKMDIWRKMRSNRDPCCVSVGDSEGWGCGGRRSEASTSIGSVSGTIDKGGGEVADEAESHFRPEEIILGNRIDRKKALMARFND